MNFEEACAKADVIFTQERMESTVNYISIGPPRSIRAEIRFDQPAALEQRNTHYYPVQEQTQLNRFTSSNYDLLCLLLGRLSSQAQRAFLTRCADRIKKDGIFARRNVPIIRAGYSDASSSELPLLAEFLVRQGASDEFIAALKEAPLSPALTLLLLHLRVMVAWNFTVFKEEELIPLAAVVREHGIRALEKQRNAERLKDQISSNTLYNVSRELPGISDAVVEECREAGFLYIKGALTREMNLEVNQDKLRVSESLAGLGFTQVLVDSLNEAENLYINASTGFDFKSSMGHLRSFLENLHLEACRKIQVLKNDDVPTKWGQTVNYLPAHGILSNEEKLFVIPFYTLLSDAAVHPLQTTQEHARLLRNISIEYGLLLLTRLETWFELNAPKS